MIRAMFEQQREAPLTIPVGRAMLCANDHLFDGVRTQQECPTCGNKEGIWLTRILRAENEKAPGAGTPRA